MTVLSNTTAKSCALASAGAVALGLLALANILLARKAERDNPAPGSFVDVDGARLHYVIRGEGPVVVLLHGNGSMIEDFDCSGLLGACASRYRVIAFDRPGYGHSPRAGSKARPPEKQADMIAAALSRLGIDDAVVVGHSWGTLVALQLALRHGDRIKGLLLASGYYFPSARLDLILPSTGAIPGLGKILNYTMIPWLARLTWPAAVRTIFIPADVPKKFQDCYPRDMAFRPSQLQTSAEETALMVPSTKGLADKCAQLSIPVALVCGAGDQVVDPRQSARLNRKIKGSTIATIMYNGHMVHHTSRIQVTEILDELVHRATQGVSSNLPQAS